VYWKGDTKDTEVWGCDDVNANRWLDAVLPLGSTSASHEDRRAVLDGFKVMMRSPVAAKAMKLGHEEVFVDSIRRLFATGHISPLQFLQCSIDIFPYQYVTEQESREQEDTYALLLVWDALRAYMAAPRETRGRIGPDLLFKVFANGYPSSVVAKLLDISPNLVSDLMNAHPWYAMHAERQTQTVLRPYTSPLANALLFEGNARPQYTGAYLDVILSRQPCAVSTVVEETGPYSTSMSLIEGLLWAKKTLYDGYVATWKQIVGRLVDLLNAPNERKTCVHSVVSLLEHFGMHGDDGSTLAWFTRQDVNQTLSAFKITLEEWNSHTTARHPSTLLSNEVASYYHKKQSQSRAGRGSRR